MTDAASKPGADDGTRGEGRTGRGKGGDPTGTRSPLVAPTGTEAPDRGSEAGRRTDASRDGRGESVPDGTTPAGRDGQDLRAAERARGDEGVPGDGGRGDGTRGEGVRGGDGDRDPALGSGRGAGSAGGSDDNSERGLRGAPGRESGLGRGAGPESATGAGTGVHKESGAHKESGVHKETGVDKKAGHESRLLAHEESDKLSTRLQHAVAGFVDEPRSAVEEADQVLEEAAARIADAVKQRRSTLRNSWQTGDGGQDKAAATASDTEQLRLVLRDYRELAERLLRS